MALLTLLIHRGQPGTCAGGSPMSLLNLPLGTGSFLQHVDERVRMLPGAENRRLVVVPAFPFDRAYEQRAAASVSTPVQVLRPDQVAGLVSECEPADTMLLVEPARWPVSPPDLAALNRSYGHYRAAIHLVNVGLDTQRARERVEHDGAGQVKRVQRFYDSVTWPEVAGASVFLSIIPARALGNLEVRSLANLRSSLSAKGVLSQDVPVTVDLVDLTQPDGVLTYTEQILANGTMRNPASGFSPYRDDVLAAPGCRIHPTARFVGRVVLHEGAVVDAGATIVGPTVVGSGARIGEHAMVAQSVLAPRTVIQPNDTIRHCVACGACCRLDRKAASSQGPVLATTQAPRGDLSRPPKVTAPGGGAPPHRRLQLVAKRGMDLALSIVGLVILGPLLVLAAILVKLTSPGPVFYADRREQQDGRDFPCLKFRTMVADAHQKQRELLEQNEVDGPQFKLAHDPRVTLLGAWLRKTNIDELPQLINVVLGQMSLVGPRPSPFRENQICVPWRRARLSVRPGITGLWQVCRDKHRAGGGFHEWIFYDLTYVRRFSIWLDIKILCTTVLTLGGRWPVQISSLIPVSANLPARPRRRPDPKRVPGRQRID